MGAGSPQLPEHLLYMVRCRDAAEKTVPCVSAVPHDTH